MGTSQQLLRGRISVRLSNTDHGAGQPAPHNKGDSMKLETFLTNLYKAYTSNNTYVNGAFGVVLKDKQLERYLTMNDYNKEHAETIKNRAANFPCFGFDCIGLIKGLVWGWNGDIYGTYGGAIYESGEIEDMNLSKFFTTYCNSITICSNTWCKIIYY